MEARLVIYIWSKIETSGKLNPRGENNDEGKERKYIHFQVVQKILD